MWFRHANVMDMTHIFDDNRASIPLFDPLALFDPLEPQAAFLPHEKPENVFSTPGR
jgi:hypothetical protein